MATATTTTKAPVKKPAAKKSPPAKKVATTKKAAPAKKPAASKPVPRVAEAPGADLLAMELLYLTHAEIHPAPDNLRAALTDLSDLADSIAATGLQQPIVVTTEISEATAGRVQHVIVAGHRRHGAIGQIIKDGRWPKGKRIPCVCGPTELSVEDRTVAMLIENLQRVDLDPIEEGTGYKRLVDAGWKQTRIAAATGRHVNRVSERIRLLLLPKSWWPKIATGELTLAHAAKLAQAPAEVLTALGKRSTPPREYELDDAIRNHRYDKALAIVKEACDARELTLSAKHSYDLMRSHHEVTACTAKQLAGVILPALDGLTVTMGDKYAATMKVTVWKPKTKGPVDDTELTPYQRWNAEGDANEEAHRAAVKEYDARKGVALLEYCRDLDTKDVAQAAMHQTLRYPDDRERFAVRLGWVKPIKVDKSTVAAHLDEWYSHATNFKAAVAIALIDTYNRSQLLSDQWDTRAVEIVGPRPVKADNPPNPNDTAAGLVDEAEEDEDEPDENAHLDSIGEEDDADG